MAVWNRGPLGGNYWRLWLASAVSVTGDGVTGTAGSLLAARITRDPLLVAGAAFAPQLPWLVFTLVSGVLADRLEPGRLMVIVYLVRAAVIGGLAALVLAGMAHLAELYGALFILGAGATVSDTAALILPPLLVGPDDLTRANAGLQAVQLVGVDLIGPLVGAWLFVLAAGLPFALDAATFAVGAALIASIRHRRPPHPVPGRTQLRREISEGIRWLAAHPGLRMLAAAICVMNMMLGSTMAVLVLYVRVRLGLGADGYGVLLACSAAGGVVGTVIVKRLLARVSASLLLRVGLIIECATHVSLALTRRPWVAALALVVFGVHNGIWVTVTVTLRQTAVPGQLLGRVNSVYYTFAVGGFALGSLTGGLLARAFGLTAPFWVAALAVGLVAVLAWRLFTPGRLTAEPAASTGHAGPGTRSAPPPLPKQSLPANPHHLKRLQALLSVQFRRSPPANLQATALRPRESRPGDKSQDSGAAGKRPKLMLSGDPGTGFVTLAPPARCTGGVTAAHAAVASPQVTGIGLWRMQNQRKRLMWRTVRCLRPSGGRRDRPWTGVRSLDRRRDRRGPRGRRGRRLRRRRPHL